MSLASRPLRRGLLLGACALLAALGVAGPAQARVINETVPLEFDNVNPCTGEAFHYATTWHIVGHTAVFDGEEIVVSAHVNSQQTDGIGEFGNKYVVNETFNTITHPTSDGASPETLNAVFNIIDTGSGDNFDIQSVFHMTVNANGDVTVFHNDGHADCRG